MSCMFLRIYFCCLQYKINIFLLKIYRRNSITLIKWTIKEKINDRWTKVTNIIWPLICLMEPTCLAKSIPQMIFCNHTGTTEEDSFGSVLSNLNSKAKRCFGTLKYKWSHWLHCLGQLCLFLHGSTAHHPRKRHIWSKIFLGIWIHSTAQSYVL